MSEAPEHQVTALLLACSGVDQQALDKPAPSCVSGTTPARRYTARESSADSLQTTAVVNELYLQWKLSIAIGSSPRKAWLLRELSKEQDHGA
jgi:hypothetical protein